MNPDLEEEMRHALFGMAKLEEVPVPLAPEPVTEVMFTKPVAVPVGKKKAAKAFTPRLRVTLRVGNEFEENVRVDP